MYNWEKYIETRVSRMRDLELASIRRASLLRAVNMALFFAIMPLVGFSAYAGAWFTGSQLKAVDIFITLAFYTHMRVPIMYALPLAIEKLSDLRLAWQRIDTFIRLTMKEEERTLHTSDNDNYQQKGAIMMRNASFSWDGHDDCLSSLNIDIEPGTFVGIAGVVGSGKSSLFAAILGEMIRTKGEINTNNSSFSYVAQTAWIFCDTLRANILFEKPYDEQRYTRVVRACCLDIDLIMLGPRGDLTIIGEKGVNLSGGQRVRVSLARAFVERIDEYARLPQEEDSGGSKRLIRTPTDWPNRGAIEFRNYSLRYRSNLEPTLKNINLAIKPCEKVGIIGRTGAGKSSLFHGLLRLVDRSTVDGEILIDDIDISRITLNHLRSHISVIPQQFALFTGTLRSNIDPLDVYSDEQCWTALEAVQLKAMASNHPAGLRMPVAESGKNEQYWEMRHKAGSVVNEQVSELCKISVNMMKKIKPVNEKQRILEIGFGDAKDASFFIDNGFIYFGTDISPTALRNAKDKLPTAEFIKGDTRLIGSYYPQCYFDLIFARLSLHFFDNEETDNIIKQIHNLLVSNGRLAFAVRSVNDSDCKQAQLHGSPILSTSNMFEYGGYTRQFFTEDSIRQSLLPRRFRIDLLEEVQSYLYGKPAVFFHVIATKME
ncbi:unnamed protein product [Rotaria sp. Silwood1]|nr:unnamed protein product [Rotaria sp. Silwood1]CAF4853709.1 unnamed protein product [Rotaria sp. Silwood1]CAF4933247.1 unnamed protein product [Rotaria sp. Silwood1]